MRPAHSLAAEILPALGSARGDVSSPCVAAHQHSSLPLTSTAGFQVGGIDVRHAHGAEHDRNRLHHRHPVHVVAADFHAANMSRV